MVGNDVGEDMVAETLGMRVFLLTDCLINSAGRRYLPLAARQLLTTCSPMRARCWRKKV